jgi:predicted DNA-binding protein YlxM (UPF0122 family)
MTLQEVAVQLRLSELTIYKNFKRTQKTLREKYGIILTKEGKEYFIEYTKQEE